jgi:uncharacterized protein YkwD
MAAADPSAGKPSSRSSGLDDRLPMSEPTYATGAVKGAAAGGEIARLVERVLLRTLREQRGEAPQGDARLLALAQWAAGRGVAASLDSGEIETAARRLGHVGPTPSLLLLRGAYSTEAAIQPVIESSIESVPNNLPLTRYAVAEFSIGSAPVIAVVLASLEVSLDPVPKQLSHLQTLHLAGALASRFDRAHLAVTLPGGRVREIEHAGRAFSADLHFDTPGTYEVELLGDGKDGPVVVANFPVYVDVSEPAPAARRATVRGNESAWTTASMEEKLLVLLNAARSDAHVPLARGDDDLAAVARAHSRDMAEHGFFGHVSPRFGTTDDRVRGAHLSGIGAYGENVVLAGDPEQAHGALMDSPGHRDNMLRPEFTHVGIAAALEGPDHFVVTYLFAQRRSASPLNRAP